MSSPLRLVSADCWLYRSEFSSLRIQKKQFYEREHSWENDTNIPSEEWHIWESLSTARQIMLLLSSPWHKWNISVVEGSSQELEGKQMKEDVFWLLLREHWQTNPMKLKCVLSVRGFLKLLVDRIVITKLFDDGLNRSCSPEVKIRVVWFESSWLRRLVVFFIWSHIP